MGETHQTVEGRGGKLGTASLWLGLFGLAFAAPPTVVFFLVPGFWVDGMNVTSLASPVFALGALLSGALGRRGPKRRQALAGIWLGLATVVCLAALATRVMMLRALEE
jgi:hypothetical protein